MFSSQIIVVLEDGTEILLPKEFRICPYGVETRGYIPSYTVEGEEYGGYEDYDFDIIYSDIDEKVYNYLNDGKKENFIDGYTIKFQIEDKLEEEFNISLDYFNGAASFRGFIDGLIDDYNLSDKSIDIILHNKQFLDEYIEHCEIDCNKDLDKLCSKTVIIDLTNIDNVFIGVGKDIRIENLY